MTDGAGTKDDPWVLKTPPGSSEYTMYRTPSPTRRASSVRSGRRSCSYDLRAIEDLHAWLVAQGDWVVLGAADEKKDAAEARSRPGAGRRRTPSAGWYGLRKGYRGRFGMYLPPLLEALGLAELTHDPRNNRMRAR